MLRVVIRISLCLALLSACAPDPAAVPAPGGTAPSGVATTAAEAPPSHTPAPGAASQQTRPPAPEPTMLAPGTNHSRAATPSAVPAATVQKWLTSPPKSKHVFLTFDDGPNHAMTPKILDVLKEAKAPATFFVLGKEVEAAPDVLKREIAEGHAVGLHSYSHNYHRLYPHRRGDKGNILDEFDTSLAAVRRVLGADFTPGPWRYPGGHMSWKDLTAADEALAARGAHWIDWNALTGDAEPKKRRPTTAAAMVEMATRPIREGCHAVVLLAHDAPDKALTLRTLPAIVAAYRSAGYEFNVIG